MHKLIQAGVLAASMAAAFGAGDAFALGAQSIDKSGLTLGVKPAERGIERSDGRFRADGVAITLGVPAFTAAVASPESMAREFIASRSAQLGFDAQSVSTLARNSLREGAHFAVVRFEQRQQGLPVFGSDVAVTVQPNGKIVYVANNSVANVQPVDTTARKSGADALEIARNFLGNSDFVSQPNKKMVYVADDGTHLVWRVTATMHDGSGDWEILIDAHDGTVLRSQDKSADVDGTGMIWTPDPLSYTRSAYGGGYVDGNNADTPELTAARVPVTFENITFDGTNYTLVGPYAVCAELETPTDAACPVQASPDFSVTRNAMTFDAGMVYFHMSQYLKYLNVTLGIPAAPRNHPGGMKFDAHGFQGADNSHYLSGTETITFGQGGVDDAQDADVIIHELGHGIHDFITNGHLSQTEGLSEGVGDYNAGAYSRDFPNQWTPADAAYFWVYNWDGHSSQTWPGRILNYQLNHTYAQARNQEIHTAGQYWSSCNLVARDALVALDPTNGGKTMDKAYFQGLTMTGSSTNQKDAAQAVINAAAALGYTQAQIDAFATAYNSGNTGGNTGCSYAVTVPSVGTAPAISVTPTSVTAAADAGSSTTTPLSIGNTGTADLTWNLDTADAATCATPATTPWISFAPVNGTVATGAAATDVTVTLDATTLAAGAYSTNICVHSNDPAHAVVAVPVSFTVNAVVDDTIFKDGFDGTPTGTCEPVQLLQDSSFEATDASGGTNQFWESVTTQGETAFWGEDGGALHVRTGTFVVWLGGYDTVGTLDPETHDASQAVVIPSGSSRYFNYWRWIDRPGNGTNVVTFTMDADVIGTEDVSALGVDTDWTQQSIDVSSYADGASHVLKMTYVHSGGDTDWDYYLDDATIDCTQTPSSPAHATHRTTRTPLGFKHVN